MHALGVLGRARTCRHTRQGAWCGQHAAASRCVTEVCAGAQRRHSADDEKGLNEDLDDASTPTSRFWASVRDREGAREDTARGGGQEGERDGKSLRPERVAMELRYPLRVFAAHAQHSRSVPWPPPSSQESAGADAALERWRQALTGAGLTWHWRPLALPLPPQWHIEKFVDDDVLVPRPPLGARGGESGEEEAGCGQGGAEGCAGKAVWVRSMAVPHSDGGCLGGRPGGSVGGEGGPEFDVGAAFRVHGIPPQRLRCGDLRPVCLAEML